MELSLSAKKNIRRCGHCIAARSRQRSVCPSPASSPCKKGASGDFGVAHRRRLCRADDRYLCPRLRPAQLLCRGAGLPLYGTWLPGAARLAAALSQSAGGAGGGAAGSYGTQRPAAATAAGFLCQKRLSPCNLPVRLCGVALDVLTPGGQALDFAAYQGFYRPIFGRLAPLFVQKRQ